MSYRVTLWNSAFGATVRKHYLSRSQAIHGMKLLAYSKLEAFAKLDTIAAHKVMADIEACDDILPPQASNNVTISNTGFELTITNTVRAPR